MKTIGLFYAMNAAKTSHIAEKIREDLGGVKVIEVVLIEKAWQNDFQAYDNMIVGASTWFDGELPTYWDELVPELESLDLKGKKVAIFGLGDQKNYPDNFVDGMGILADAFQKAGAELVGFTSTDGYTFNQSRAVRGEKFCGLVIDQENQAQLTSKRIADWCKLIKEDFTSNKKNNIANHLFTVGAHLMRPNVYSKSFSDRFNPPLYLNKWQRLPHIFLHQYLLKQFRRHNLPLLHKEITR